MISQRRSFIWPQEEKDRDLTKFFWYRITQDSKGHYNNSDEVMTYRITRLPFGLTFSPFLLYATLMEHADRHKATFPTAAPLIDSNTFMDDFAACEENDNVTIVIYYKLTALMKLINFLFAKWSRNSEQLKAIWRAEGQDIEVKTQLLGLIGAQKLIASPLARRQILRSYQKGILQRNSSCKARLGSTTHSDYTVLCLLGHRGMLG